MDARNYVRYMRMDEERRREEAWRELHRRPDAEPLPYEPERTWADRVRGLAGLAAAYHAWRAARARPGVAAARARTRMTDKAHADLPRPG